MEFHVLGVRCFCVYVHPSSASLYTHILAYIIRYRTCRDRGLAAGAAAGCSVDVCASYLCCAAGVERTAAAAVAAIFVCTHLCVHSTYGFLHSQHSYILTNAFYMCIYIYVCIHTRADLISHTVRPSIVVVVVVVVSYVLLGLAFGRFCM